MAITKYSAVRGLDDLHEALAELTEGVQKRLVFAAARKAAAPILARVIEKVPRGTGKGKNSRGKGIGHLADSLIFVEKKEKTGTVREVIGSATHGQLIHLVEFGTAPHEIYQPAKGGRPARTIYHPGAAAKPFLRPAIDEAGDEAIEAFVTEAVTRLWQEVAKAQRKGTRAARSIARASGMR